MSKEHSRRKLKVTRQHSNPPVLPPQFTQSLNPNPFDLSGHPTIPTTPIPPSYPPPSYEPLYDALKDLNLGTDNKPPKTPAKTPIPTAGFEPTYFSAPKAGKENDAPLNGNIPGFDPLKKEHEELRRHNEELRMQLDLLSKKYQTDVEEKVNVLQQENFYLKTQIESLNSIIAQYKEEEKEREASAKEDISMENINSKLNEMNVESKEEETVETEQAPETTTTAESVKVETVETFEQEYEEETTTTASSSSKNNDIPFFMPATSIPEMPSFGTDTTNTFFTPLSNIFSEDKKVPSFTRKSRGTRKSTTVPKPAFNFASEPSTPRTAATPATPSTPPPEPTLSLKDKAEKAKLAGNKAFVNDRYLEAVSHYSEAIRLSPNDPLFYGNRAAAYLMLNKFNEALSDCISAISIDKYYFKGYTRAADCYVNSGLLEKAEQEYKTLLQVVKDHKNAETWIEKANEGIKHVQHLQQQIKEFESSLSSNPIQALKNAEILLQSSPQCVKFKLLEGRALLKAKRYVDLKEKMNKIVDAHQDDLWSVMSLKGMAEYYLSNFTDAVYLFEGAKDKDMLEKIKMYEAKKTSGNEAYEKGLYEKAVEVYNEALEIDVEHALMNRIFFANRAAALMKLGKYKEALKDCTKAIEIDPGYLKAYLRRASIYSTLENYSESVKDYQQASRIDRTDSNIRVSLREAEAKLRKSKNKSHYEILEIDPASSPGSIKKQYKKMALKWHPDKNTESHEMRNFAEVQFKLLSEAYAVLSDPIKRKDYDYELLTKRSSANSYDAPFSFSRFNNESRRSSNYDPKRDSPVGGGRKSYNKNNRGYNWGFDNL